MSTHLLKPGPLSNLRARCGKPLSGLRGALGTEDGIEHVDCVGCLRDLIVEMRIEANGLGDTREARWLAGGDTGTSSLTIWHVMTGNEMPKDRHPSVPHDPADFGRCHRLLELFPEWRERMPKVGKLYPEWSRLVAEWPALTALYEQELPMGRAPKLYARMRELTVEPLP